MWTKRQESRVRYEMLAAKDGLMYLEVKHAEDFQQLSEAKQAQKGF